MSWIMGESLTAEEAVELITTQFVMSTVLWGIVLVIGAMIVLFVMDYLHHR